MDGHFFRKTGILVILTLSCTVAAARARAQDFERYRPLTLPPAVPQPLQLAPSERQVEGSDAVLVESLDAVIVVDHADKIEPLNAFEDASGLSVNVADRSSLVYSPQFRAIVESYLGQPITLRRLNQMARDIIVFYRRSGLPVVDVVIPEQKITAGTVQIIVVEARVGRVIVEGPHYFDPCMLADQIECTLPGDKVRQSAIEADVLWLSRNAFRRVDIDLRPGAEEGTTDVVFRVNDVLPLRGYFGYEDTGVRALGLERLFAGFIWGNAFGRDGQFSYQYTTDVKFDHLESHAGFYERAWNRDWSFQAYGAWAGVSPDAPALLLQDGVSWQVGAGLVRRLTYDAYEQSSLTFGVDFKSTNNNLEFGGINVFAGQADLLQLNFGYDLVRRYDQYAYLLVANDLFIGPGEGFTAYNDPEGFSTIRPGTSPDYIYDRLFVERSFNLPSWWQFVARATGQITSERLLFSETLSLGGYDSIRGYDQRLFNADAGYVAQLEIGPKAWDLGDAYTPSQLRVYGFYDFGNGFILDPEPGEVPREFLSSVGAGFRYTYDNRLSVRFYYGYALDETVDQVTDYRVHLGLVYLLGPQP